MKRTLNFEKMKVTPKENWGGCLTKGKEYEVVKEVSDNYVITDDSGCQIGWKQDRFNVVNEFEWKEPEQVIRPWEYYQPLFDYFSEEHNLTLLQGELEEIIEMVHSLENVNAN